MRRAQEIENYELTVDLEKCEVRDDQGFRGDVPDGRISYAIVC